MYVNKFQIFIVFIKHQQNPNLVRRNNVTFDMPKNDVYTLISSI
jgi:hypothetical protein